MNARLPAIQLLILISLFVAVLLLVNIWRKGWVLPVIVVALWALVALVVGGAYPAFVQRFQVGPAELAKEKPFIERNIDATRDRAGPRRRGADRLRLPEAARPRRRSTPSGPTWTTPACSTRP